MNCCGCSRITGEGDGSVIWRWNDGDAILPALDEGLAMIEALISDAVRIRWHWTQRFCLARRRSSGLSQRPFALTVPGS